MPESAKKLRDIEPGFVPYISTTDLVVFKIHSCGLRAVVAKRRVDARDARDILKVATRAGALGLSDAQQAAVESCIQDVVHHGDMTVEWWKQRLGLPVGR